jgi:hypothetical protein
MQTVYEARSALLQYEEGRGLHCTGVQRLISDGDRRSMRARRIRAHMRGCNACQAFEVSVTTRRRDFGLLVPIAGKGGFAALLALLRSSGGARLAGLATRIQSAPGGLRGAAVGAALLATGAGVVEHVHHVPHARGASLVAGKATAAQRDRRSPEIVTRTADTIRTRTAAAKPRGRKVVASNPNAGAHQRQVRPLSVPMPVPPPRMVASGPTTTGPSTAPAQGPKEPVATASVSTAGHGRVQVTATIGPHGGVASVSGSVVVAAPTPATAVTASIANVTARLAASACLLHCG